MDEVIADPFAARSLRLQFIIGGCISKSRRQFLAPTSLGVLGMAAARPSQAQKPPEPPPDQAGG